jgi:hypothetical protein
MTRSQVRLMVDELAEDVRQYVFHALDNEICIQGEEAGRRRDRAGLPPRNGHALRQRPT